MPRQSARQQERTAILANLAQRAARVAEDKKREDELRERESRCCPGSSQLAEDVVTYAALSNAEVHRQAEEALGLNNEPLYYRLNALDELRKKEAAASVAAAAAAEEESGGGVGVEFSDEENGE